MKQATIGDIQDFIQTHQSFVIVQADNPDGDSLASSLALEAILEDLGKHPYLYCGVTVPGYLRYLSGWDRVDSDLPKQFDAVIIVDTSVRSLLESAEKSKAIQELQKRPTLVLDHHTEATCDIPFATLVYNQPVTATGEAIYDIALASNWELSVDACQFIAVSILADSLGLMSEATSSKTIRIMADLVDKGVQISLLDASRRELMRKSPELLAYKGRLLERVQYSGDGRVAYITIPWEEIEMYSPQYNPSMLVLDDMRLVDNVDVAIAFKVYKDGKITGKVRCNYKKAIGADLASAFGGGGHPYASGFKVTDGTSITALLKDVLTKTSELLDALQGETT